MESTERRSSQRSSLNHPVMLNRKQRERCLASILDVGHKGLRVRVDSPADITVGHEIEVTSARLPASGNGARLSCRVVWENRDLEELGLEFMAAGR